MLSFLKEIVQSRAKSVFGNRLTESHATACDCASNEERRLNAEHICVEAMSEENCYTILLFSSAKLFLARTKP